MTQPDDKQLDVTGVCCPMPLIQLSQQVQGMKPGEVISITGNDPIFETTVRDFCSANGHAVVGAAHGENRAVTLRIRVGG